MPLILGRLVALATIPLAEVINDPVVETAFGRLLVLGKVTEGEGSELGEGGEEVFMVELFLKRFFNVFWL